VTVYQRIRWRYAVLVSSCSCLSVCSYITDKKAKIFRPNLVGSYYVATPRSLFIWRSKVKVTGSKTSAWVSNSIECLLAKTQWRVFGHDGLSLMRMWSMKRDCALALRYLQRRLRSSRGHGWLLFGRHRRRCLKSKDRADCRCRSPRVDLCSNPSSLNSHAPTTSAGRRRFGVTLVAVAASRPLTSGAFVANRLTTAPPSPRQQQQLALRHRQQVLARLQQMGRNHWLCDYWQLLTKKNRCGHPTAAVYCANWQVYCNAAAAVGWYSTNVKQQYGRELAHRQDTTLSLALFTNASGRKRRHSSQ